MIMANYSELPEEIIDLCLKPLIHMDDRIRFGAACKSWRSSFVATRKSFCYPPWLMIPEDADDYENLRIFSCLSGEDSVIIGIELPDIQGTKCWGSPYGWLVTFGFDLSIHLLNPFTRVRIPLPHQSTFPNQYPEEILEDLAYVRKVAVDRFVLSSNPSLANQSQPCFVMAISNPGGKLIFAKPGDTAWNAVETPDCCRFDDAIYFKGQVYAFDHEGSVSVYDINVPCPTGKIIETPPPPTLRSWTEDTSYLVEMKGELLLLIRCYDDSRSEYLTENFYIYNFRFSTESWIEVSDLGDYALFVGNLSPFVISTNDWPDFKRNAVYYTDHHLLNLALDACDMFVYDYEKKTSEPFYKGSIELSWYTRPTFIIPSLF